MKVRQARASRTRRGVIALSILSASALGLTACSPESTPTEEGTGSGDVVSIDVGLDAPIEWPEGQKLSIAFFQFFSGNAYTRAGIEAFESAAEDIGADYEWFDGQADAQTQVNQIETALAGGKFNAMIVLPVDTNLECDLLTNEAPAAGIVVVSVNATLCDRDLKPVDELWAPGTLSFVGTARIDSWGALRDYVVEDNPGGGEVVVLNGPAGAASSRIMTQLFEEELVADNPEFTIASSQNMAGFSAEDGYTATQTALAQHPDAKIFISSGGDMYRGITQAVDEAGLTGQVKIYDTSADKTAMQAVSDGVITALVPDSPASMMKTAVEILDKATKGESIERLYLNDGNPGPSGDYSTVVISKDNLDDYTAEY